MQCNIHEAKTQLSKLIQAAEEGQEVIICRHGTPVARLVGLRSKQRPEGIWQGKGWIADDFNELPPELEDAFYGSSD